MMGYRFPSEPDTNSPLISAEAPEQPPSPPPEHAALSSSATAEALEQPPSPPPTEQEMLENGVLLPAEVNSTRSRLTSPAFTPAPDVEKAAGILHQKQANVKSTITRASVVVVNAEVGFFRPEWF
jgi:hypothetical protein